MYQFDVKYTFDNYYEYYKFVLVKQRILRDVIFSLLFFGIAIYWFVDSSPNTDGFILPIFAIVMGVLFPFMNFASIPLLKKQIKGKQAEIDRTHILVTFNEDEVVYENLTVKPEPVAADPTVEEAPVEEPIDEKEAPTTEEVEEVSTNEEETTEEAPKEETTEEVKEEPAKDPNVFNLQYGNFGLVRELKNIFLFYLDRQTIIILPKNTLTGDVEGFKTFVASKIDPKRVKFLKK